MLKFKEIEGYRVFCSQDDFKKPVHFHASKDGSGEEAKVVMLRSGNTIVERQGSIPEMVLTEICSYMELIYNEFLQFWRNKFYFTMFVG